MIRRILVAAVLAGSFLVPTVVVSAGAAKQPAMAGPQFAAGPRIVGYQMSGTLPPGVAVPPAEVWHTLPPPGPMARGWTITRRGQVINLNFYNGRKHLFGIVIWVAD